MGEAVADREAEGVRVLLRPDEEDTELLTDGVTDADAPTDELNKTGEVDADKLSALDCEGEVDGERESVAAAHTSRDTSCSEA